MRRPNSTEGSLSLINSNRGGRRAYLSTICLVLCSAAMAGVPAVRADQTATGQDQIEALHVPELDASFHLLYELKPEEARSQFESLQKSHPEDPLGSAADAAAYLFEECYQQARPLCQKCARIRSFHAIGVSFERKADSPNY